MSDDLETLDREISRLQAEAAAVERAGPTFEERWPEIESQLLEAENVFRRLGPQLSGFVSELPEHVHQRRQAMVGMALVANRRAIVDSEQARIKAQTEGGISATAKSHRLAELRRAVLRSAAQRELELRKIEGDDFAIRSVHPELVIFTQAAVERLATAR